MRTTNTLVVGGGQAGLAMSRRLSERGVDHVVLERGRVGERWRSERWDSLRLLTPNWQSRLPGWSYRGPDPDGFMTRGEVIDLLDSYARSFSAPMETGVRVTAVGRDGADFRVETDRGAWRAGSVVIATGNCDVPCVPAFAGRLARDVHQVVPTRYRRPSDLPPGGVLVVGASATGVQLAEEIHRSGRPVTLSVGRHTRLPRRYRGRDIQRWLDAIGLWDQTVSEVIDLERSRNEPSLQLIGSTDHRSIELGVLQAEGVRLVGRALDVQGDRVTFAGDLAQTLGAADARLERLLRRIDDHIVRQGMSGEVPSCDPVRAVHPPAAPESLDLRRSGIETVVWATGYRREYPWLKIPVLDPRGEIRHDGGVTPVPGLYVLGLQFLRTRKSSLLDGVGADAAYLADHIAEGRGSARQSAA